MSSTSTRARDDLERAERSTERRSQRFSWRDVPAAVRWFFEYREKMQAPMSPKVRVEEHWAPDGALVLVPVEAEGGRGGDLDGILVVVSTIGAALHKLRKALPGPYDMLVKTHRDGWTQRKLADQYEISVSSVSAELGKGESYLLALLRDAEVIS